MKRRVFMDMLDLAWQDFKSQSPDTAVGIAIIMLHRSPDDHLEVQVGTNVAPEVVKFAFMQLVEGWLNDEHEFDYVKPRTPRKVI